VTTRPRFGPYRLTEPYELWDAEAQNKVGLAALQSLFHLMAEFCYDPLADAPISGFAGNGFKVTTGAGDLGIVVDAGFGMGVVAGSPGEWDAHYAPLVKTNDTPITLAAHAAQARIDLICARASTVDDESTTRTVWDTGTGTSTSATLDTRRRYQAEIQVVEGTPGTPPSAPATPAGWMALAEAFVPATAGARTLLDRRSILQLGQHFTHGPDRPHAGNHVMRDSYASVVGELEVARLGAAPSLQLLVQPGESHIEGRRYRYSRPTTLTTLPDGGNPRWATVYCNQGNIQIIHGAPAGSPVKPGLIAGLGQMRLADVYLPAAATTVDPADIDDVRQFGHIKAEHMQPDSVVEDAIVDAAVTESKLGFTTLVPDLTVGALAAGKIPIDLVSKNLAGEVVGNSQWVVELYEEDGQLVSDATIILEETGAGTEYTTSSATHPRMYLGTDANGEAQVSVSEVTRTGAYNMYVRFTPMNDIGVSKMVFIAFT